MTKKVIVYTTNDCIECEMVKKVLTEEGIPFEARNIAVNPEFKQEVEKYGYMGVPVTVAEGRAIKGFTNELKEIIEVANRK